MGEGGPTDEYASHKAKAEALECEFDAQVEQNNKVPVNLAQQRTIGNWDSGIGNWGHPPAPYHAEQT